MALVLSGIMARATHESTLQSRLVGLSRLSRTLCPLIPERMPLSSRLKQPRGILFSHTLRGVVRRGYSSTWRHKGTNSRSDRSRLILLSHVDDLGFGERFESLRKSIGKFHGTIGTTTPSHMRCRTIFCLASSFRISSGRSSAA